MKPHGFTPLKPENIPPPPDTRPRCDLSNDIKGRFHVFCVGCKEMEPISNQWEMTAHNEVVHSGTMISCKHYDRCAEMVKSLKQRDASRD